jgi:hypothetical protein
MSRLPTIDHATFATLLAAWAAYVGGVCGACSD